MKHPPKEVITKEHWTTLHLRTHPSQTKMSNRCFLFEPYLTIDQCWVSSSCGLWRDGLWKPLVQTNECMRPLPIRDMKEGYFRHCTWGKGCSASLPATSRWQDKKSRLPFIREKNKDIILKEGAKSSVTTCPQGCEGHIYYLVSFDVVPPYFVKLLLALVPQILLLASKICVYLDVAIIYCLVKKNLLYLCMTHW
jgi:hypothetical protein